MVDAVRDAGDGTPRRPNTQAVAPSPSDLASENARLRRENERLRHFSGKINMAIAGSAGET